LKILFDVNTPLPLARYLRGHEVTSAIKLNWHALRNGVLLDAAENARFDLLLTCDQSIPYQQNFADRKIAVVILSSNRWRRLRPVAARIASAVDFAQRGQVIRLDITTL
jgi:hypothetical protein